MAVYKYRARTASGRPVRGRVEAADKHEAIGIIRRHCPVIERITQVRRPRSERLALLTEPFAVNERALSLAAVQLACLLRSGIAPAEAVRLAAGQCGDKYIKRLLGAAADGVEAGGTLADSLAGAGRGLPEIFIETVRAGESSSALPPCLELLGGYYERLSALRGKVKSALIYPVILLALSAVVIAVVTVFLLPTVTSVLAQSGGELPTATRVLLGVSDFVRRRWIVLLTLAAALIIILALFSRRRAGKIFFGRVALRLPVIGKIAGMNAAAQFASTFSVLLSAGVAAPRAAAVASGAVSNRAVGESLAAAAERIEQGKSISSALARVPYMPQAVVSMAAVGEETGRLGEMMRSAGKMHEDAAQTAAARLLALLDPVMIIFMGVVVGAILLAIYVPLFSMYSSIG